uniref:Uncharacterized protein n=1 Tax=Rhizophora mucronata TaxID=61149 RepID=A0A2P2P077_RHIMU
MYIGLHALTAYKLCIVKFARLCPLVTLVFYLRVEILSIQTSISSCGAVSTRKKD